jgi:hypothetical protein
LRGRNNKARAIWLVQAGIGMQHCDHRRLLLISLVTLCVAMASFADYCWCQETSAQKPATDTQASQTPTTSNAPSAAKSGANVAAQELANQVNNPAAPVTFIQFRDILLPDPSATKGAVNALQIQPVLPIGPFHWFPYVQLMKITLPLVISTPGIAPPIGCIACGSGTQGVTGLGDMQVFDLVTIKQSWGRWGLGPSLIFPTATKPQLGAGKWLAGPSVAIIYTGIKNLTAGFVLQNPISFAGSPRRPGVNQMIITPTFTFNLKDGWFVGMSDYNFSWNWESNGAATIPIGLQAGKVVRIGKQPVSLSIEAGGVAARPAGTPNPGVILGFELSPIFNFHIGPGQKVKVRGNPSESQP